MSAPNAFGVHRNALQFAHRWTLQTCHPATLLEPHENTRPFIKYWVPVLLWMVFIFIGSTDLMSAEHTSRFIGPVLRWFAPDITDATIASVQLVVRKCAHLADTRFWPLCFIAPLAKASPDFGASLSWLLSLLRSTRGSMNFTNRSSLRGPVRLGMSWSTASARSSGWRAAGLSRSQQIANQQPKIGNKMVGLAGLEPATLRLSSACSNQLSYRPKTAAPRESSISDCRISIGFSGASRAICKSEICNLQSEISQFILRCCRSSLRYRTFVKLYVIAAAFSLVLLSASARAEDPPSAPPIGVPPMEFKHFTLPNGLEVYTVEDHDTPDRGGAGLVSRWLERRSAGPERFRAHVRAHDV